MKTKPNIITDTDSYVVLNNKTLKKGRDYIIDDNHSIILSNKIIKKINHSSVCRFASAYYCKKGVK